MEKTYTLDAAAKQLAEIIAQAPNKEPLSVLISGVDMLFQKWDNDLSTIGEIMFQTMGETFDPSVAYTPLFEVMYSFQDNMKNYNWICLSEDIIAKLVVRKYIMDRVWSYANPESDNKADFDTPPTSRKDYSKINQYFSGAFGVTMFIFYDIEKEFQELVLNKFRDGATVDDVIALNQKNPLEMRRDGVNPLWGVRNLEREGLEMMKLASSMSPDEIDKFTKH